MRQRKFQQNKAPECQTNAEVNKSKTQLTKAKSGRTEKSTKGTYDRLFSFCKGNFCFFLSRIKEIICNCLVLKGIGCIL
jgi:hypothetical protein